MALFKVLFFCLFSSIIFGQSHPNNEIDSLLRSGIENIMLQEYTEAVNTFKILDSKYNNIPLGNIYLAATEITKAVDFHEDLKHEYLDSLLSFAKHKSDSLMGLNEDSIWPNYYHALTLGYSAYYHSVSGNIISAFSDGVLSLHGFQKCLEINPNFSEAYIAIGTYNYWKSAQTKALLWIPFIPDKREEGIELLEKSINSNSYNHHLAVYSLIWIYIDYGESAKAVDLSLSMLGEYPESRYFRWGLARAYQDVDKQEAINVYSEILQSIKKIPDRNQFNDIVILHKIAMLYEELGNLNESLELCNEILDFEFKSAKIKEKLEDRLERTEDLKEAILERLN